MNKHRLSSLHVLTTFVVACETLNLKVASEKLHLSPSAVSRQIQTLEEELGFDVFVRKPRGLAMTEKGQMLYESAKQALSLLDNTIESIRMDECQHRLRVSAQLYFSKQWLMPRLKQFCSLHPEVNIQFESKHTYSTFDSKVMDVAIRFAPSKQQDLQTVKLFNQYALPVASPELVDRFELQAGIKQWSQCNWLHVDSRQDAWDLWLKENACSTLCAANNITFDDPEAIVQAAIQGMGIAIVAWPLVNALLEENRLVALAKPSPSICSPYYLVYSNELETYAPLVSFKQWLLAEAASEPDINDFK